MVIVRPSVLALTSVAALHLRLSGAVYTGIAANDTSAAGESSLSGRAPHPFEAFSEMDNVVVAEQRPEALDPRGGANATSLSTRDVWNPKITSPGASTVWVVGSKVTVTWDTSNAPQHVTNGQGKILLGHLDDGADEHLDVEHPLAQNVDLTRGSATVSVPQVSPGNDYIVVVMGDSGNQSPTFTIN